MVELIFRIDMKRKAISIIGLVALLGLSSCIGEHNSAPNSGLNHDSKRIYGNKGGEPKQLPNKYESDAAVDERAAEIREKLFPN